MEHRTSDHLVMLLSIIYAVVRRLLDTLTVIIRRESTKDVELLVLRHENAVLRRQVGSIRRTPADRLWLATFSRLLPRHCWAHIFPVQPATLLTWHRNLAARKWDYSTRRRPGRPPTPATIKQLVVRMAQENPNWGPPRLPKTPSVLVSTARGERWPQSLDQPLPLSASTAG
jgi:hypothetical protein